MCLAAALGVTELRPLLFITPMQMKILLKVMGMSLTAEMEKPTQTLTPLYNMDAQKEVAQVDVLL